jgi:predicted amidophosphoribosyltransferase
LQSLNSGTANLSQKATECGECGQPLEEWEAGVCEGCGTPWEQDEYKSFTAKN